MPFVLFFFLNLFPGSAAIPLSKTQDVVHENVSCGLPEQIGYVFNDGRDGVLSQAEITSGLAASDMSEAQVGDFLNAVDSNGDGEFTEEEIFAQMIDLSVSEAERRAYVHKFINVFELYDDNVGATWDASCSIGFVSNSDSSVVCQSDGTWTFARGCILDPTFNISDGPSFIEVGSPGQADCGQPSFNGYLFWSNADHQLQRSEWVFDREAFQEADSDRDGFISAAELDAQGLNVHDIFLSYDVDQTVSGSVKEGECSDGYSGTASVIICSAQGDWSVPSGCAMEGTSLIEKESRDFLNTSNYQSELENIVKWIAAEFSKSTCSFCYRHYYDRGAGTPVHCGGLVQVGMQCYNHCSKGNGVGMNCVYYNHIRCRWHGWSLRCSGGNFESYFRGGGHWASSCSSGRQNEDALCYTKPRHRYHCTATICHKECDYELGIVGCGFAACSSDDAACGQAIAGMVLAPMAMVLNVVTMGSSKGLTSGLKKIKTAVGKINDCLGKAGLVHGSVDIFTRALLDFIEIAKDNVYAITPSHIHQYLRNLCQDFSDTPSPMTKKCIEPIAEKWARKLAYSVAASADQAAVFMALEEIDPTGILGVVNAYNKPNCEDAQADWGVPHHVWEMLRGGRS